MIYPLREKIIDAPPRGMHIIGGMVSRMQTGLLGPTESVGRCALLAGGSRAVRGVADQAVKHVLVEVRFVPGDRQ
jgi:hypothetical protein